MADRLEIVTLIEDALDLNMRNWGEDESWLEEDTRLEIAELVTDELMERGYIQ